MAKRRTRRVRKNIKRGGGNADNKSRTLVFYHIYCNEFTLPILKDQVTKIIFSGLYSAVETVHCVLSGEEKHMEPIRAFLTESGVKFVINAEVGTNDTSYERFTLQKIPKNIQDTDKFLYIHTKGVSAKHSGDDKVYWWRNWMEYHLIHRFKECLEALDKVNLVGVGYMTWQIGAHFSGNFWWTKGSYFKTLPKKEDGSLNIGDGYNDPESFVFKGEDPSYMDMDKDGASKEGIDYYSSKSILVRPANGPAKGGRRRAR